MILVGGEKLYNVLTQYKFFFLLQIPYLHTNKIALNVNIEMFIRFAFAKQQKKGSFMSEYIKLSIIWQ